LAYQPGRATVRLWIYGIMALYKFKYYYYYYYYTTSRKKTWPGKL